MTNYDWLMSMPKAMFAQWLCDINKCDHCFFKALKDEYSPGTCTWQWLNQKSPFNDTTQEETTDERP